jgi:hypothetical protein
MTNSEGWQVLDSVIVSQFGSESNGCFGIELFSFGACTG